MPNTPTSGRVAPRVVLEILLVLNLLLSVQCTSEIRPQKQPTDADLNRVDNIVKEAHLANAVFTAPDSMYLEEVREIQFLIGPTQTLDELRTRIRDQEELKNVQIQISDVMEASLSGSEFEVTKITAERQAVSRTAVTEWGWEIKARKPGKQNLHLTLNYVVEESDAARSFRAFDKVIEVEVLPVSSILEKMNSGNVVFNEPNSWRLEGDIQMLLGTDEAVDDLKKILREPGNIKVVPARVSDEMEANLFGSAFDITEGAPKQQTINKKAVNEWTWHFKAKEPGRQVLSLRLNAVTSEGSDHLRAISVINPPQRIEVQVSAISYVWVGFWRFVFDKWEWFVATIVALVTWLSGRAIWKKYKEKLGLS